MKKKSLYIDIDIVQKKQSLFSKKMSSSFFSGPRSSSSFKSAPQSFSSFRSPPPSSFAFNNSAITNNDGWKKNKKSHRSTTLSFFSPLWKHSIQYPWLIAGGVVGTTALASMLLRSWETRHNFQVAQRQYTPTEWAKIQDNIQEAKQHYQTALITFENHEYNLALSHIIHSDVLATEVQRALHNKQDLTDIDIDAFILQVRQIKTQIELVFEKQVVSKNRKNRKNRTASSQQQTQQQQQPVVFAQPIPPPRI